MATTTPKQASKAATTTREKPDAKPPAKGSLDYLQAALEDVDKARQAATGEMRERLDSAVARLRDAVSDLRERAGGDVDEFQESLDRASDHLRVELGLRAIRAQQSPEALTRLSSAIRERRTQLAS